MYKKLGIFPSVNIGYNQKEGKSYENVEWYEEVKEEERLCLSKA